MPMARAGKISLQQGDIAFQDLGSGHPIVLLRGLGRCVRHWNGFEHKLARHMRVIVFDLRGVDSNSVPMKPWTTLFDMADDVKTVLDELGIDKATIMGVSLGGMLALACGIKYPTRCASLVVVNSSIAGQRAMRLSFSALFAISRFAWDPDKMEEHLIEALTGPDMTSAAKAAAVEAYAKIRSDYPTDPGVVAAQLLAAARFQVAKKLARLRVPTLVIYGSHDRFVPNIHSKKIAKLIPGAKLIELENAGHEPHLDKPEEMIAVLSDWTAHLH